MSSSDHYIRSRVFKNRSLDNGSGSFSNESSGGSKFGRSSQPFADTTSQGRLRDSGSSRFGRGSRPFVEGEGYNRFCHDMELKVNSGDIGRIIGLFDCICIYVC